MSNKSISKLLAYFLVFFLLSDVVILYVVLQDIGIEGFVNALLFQGIVITAGASVLR